MKPIHNKILILLLITHDYIQTTPSVEAMRNHTASQTHTSHAAAKFDPRIVTAKESNHSFTKNSSLMEEYIPTDYEIMHDHFYRTEPASVATKNPSSSSMASWFRFSPKIEQEYLNKHVTSEKIGEIDFNPVITVTENRMPVNEPLQEISFKENEIKLGDTIQKNSTKYQQTTAKKPEQDILLNKNLKQEISTPTAYSLSTATHDRNGILTSLEYNNHTFGNSPEIFIQYKSPTIIATNKAIAQSVIITKNGKEWQVPFEFNIETNKYTAKVLLDQSSSITIEFDPRSTTRPTKITESKSGQLVMEAWFDSRGSISSEKFTQENKIISTQYTKTGKVVSEYDAQGNKKNIPFEKMIDDITINIENRVLNNDKISHEKLQNVINKEIARYFSEPNSALPLSQLTPPEIKKLAENLDKTEPQDSPATNFIEPNITPSTFIIRLKAWIEKIVQIISDFMKKAEEFRQNHIVSSRQKLKNEINSFQNKRHNNFTQKIRSEIPEPRPRKETRLPEPGIDMTGWNFSYMSSRPAKQNLQ